MVKDAYFADKNYALLYVHNFFHKMSSSLMYMLTGAYFLDIGVAIPLIILFFGLEFGLRGTLCPVGLKIFNKLGPVYATLLTSFLKIMFFLLMVQVEDNHMMMFVALCFYAMGGAIFYPFKDVMEAIYIKDDHNRGKQMSLSSVIMSFSGIIGVILGAYLIAHYGYIAIVFLASAALFLSSIPFAFMQGKAISLDNYQIKDGYKFVFSDNFKDLIFPLAAEQLRIIMIAVFVPLFIYTIIGDLEKYSYLAAAALVVETVITLLTGKRVDNKGVSHTLQRAFYFNAATSLFLSTCVVNPFMAFIGDSMNKISNNTYMTAMRSGMHLLIGKRDKGNLMLFGCAYQIILCWGELVVLSILAGVSYFIGHYVFYIGFFLGALGCFLSWRFFAQKEKQITGDEVIDAAS